MYIDFKLKIDKLQIKLWFRLAMKVKVQAPKLVEFEAPCTIWVNLFPCQ